MANPKVLRFQTINAYFDYRGLPRPAHPLVTLIHLDGVPRPYHGDPTPVAFDFYAIALKHMHGNTIKYGQQSYDFDDGVLFS